MTASFQLLRSNDLIWSRLLKNYLLGEREPLNDLMAWNADATRMPARMHSEYLRDIFFENQLAEGRYLVDGHAIALRDIKAPDFRGRNRMGPYRALALGLSDQCAGRYRCDLPPDQWRS